MCKVTLETPVNLSRKQKDMLEELKSSMKGQKNSPRQESWFEGMKNFFGDLKM